MVAKLSKMSYYIPFCSDMTAGEVAKLIPERVI